MTAPKSILWLAVLAFCSAGFPAALTASPSFGQKITIRDSLGRTVVVPSRAERILSLQPEITRIVVALGAEERLVGLDYFIRRDDHLFKIVFPAQSRLPVVSKPDDSINKEMVVRLSPDVIFASPSEFLVPETIQRNLGIPVIALASMGSFAKILEEIEVVGMITGLSERAQELTAYFKEKIGLLAQAVASVPAENRPRVYLAFWSSLLRTPVSYEPVEVAGGRNAAQQLVPSYLGTIGTVVTLEQIIKWDPDVILVHGNFLPAERQVTVQGILEDRRLGSVKAVRNRKVYYTFGFWYWWDPAEVLVETLNLAKIFHPEKFSPVDMAKEGDEIFEKFYRKKNIFTALSKVLDFHDWREK